MYAYGFPCMPARLRLLVPDGTMSGTIQANGETHHISNIALGGGDRRAQIAELVGGKYSSF